jgi:hypothetical protein
VSDIKEDDKAYSYATDLNCIQYRLDIKKTTFKKRRKKFATILSKKQLKPLNVIALGKRETDNIIQMITIST